MTAGSATFKFDSWGILGYLSSDTLTIGENGCLPDTLAA